MTNIAGHLYFHRVADNDDHYTCMPRQDFARVLDAILAVHPIVSVAQALARVADPDLPPAMVLSFDDGHADLLDFAVPAMAARGIVATLFVPTDHVGGRMTWRRDGCTPPVLSAADLRMLAERGFDIQCHGASHVRLDAMTDVDLVREMTDAADRLADLIGRAVRSFAYPYGVYDGRSRAVARGRFDAAFSTVKSIDSDWHGSRDALRRTFVDRTHAAREIMPALWQDSQDARHA